MSKEKLNIESVPVSIPNQPKIVGLSRTEPSFANKYINSSSVPKISSVKTFGDLVSYQAKLRQSLQSSNLFKTVEISSNVFADDEKSAIDDDKVSVLINVVEKNKINGRIGFDADPNNPGSVETGFSLKLSNCFLGRGESLELESNKDPLNNFNSAGTNPFAKVAPDTYKLNFHKPIVTERDVYSPLSAINVSLFDKANDLPWLSSTDRSRGLGLDAHLTGNKNCSHWLSYNFLWRHLKSSDENLKFSIREKLGHSLKSSVTYAAKYSTLSNELGVGEDKIKNTVPTSGYNFSPKLEFAGFSGSSKFLKFSLGAKICQTFDKLTLAATMRAGAMTGSSIDLQDKFFLGGPLDLRGYAQNKANPADGGLNMAAVGAHVYYPLSSYGLNLHGFVTTGSVFNKPSDIQKSVKTGAGGGVVFGITPDIHAEINYVKRADGEGKCSFGIGFATL